MELKKYQNRVVADLEDFLTQVNEQPTLSDAFKVFWESRQIEVGTPQMPGYQNVIDGVPHVCYKVPTGGGKTFFGVCISEADFRGSATDTEKVVVWLVPLRFDFDANLGGIEESGPSVSAEAER